jgi:hypothetical protein
MSKRTDVKAGKRERIKKILENLRAEREQFERMTNSHGQATLTDGNGVPADVGPQPICP